MSEAALALGIYVVTILAMLAVTVPAYLRLLRWLEDDHPDAFTAMGSPTIYNRSPRKSLALQKFIYRGSKAPDITVRVARQSRWVGRVTALFVGLLLVELIWLLIAGSRVASALLTGGELP